MLGTMAEQFYSLVRFGKNSSAILNTFYSGNFISIWVDDFKEATVTRDKKRKYTPPVYNALRLKEKPMPLLVLCSGDQNLDSEAEQAGNDPLCTNETEYDASNASLDNVTSENESESSQHYLSMLETSIIDETDFTDDLLSNLSMDNNNDNVQNELSQGIMNTGNENGSVGDVSYVNDVTPNQLHANTAESIVSVSPCETADKVSTNNENDLGANSAESIGAVSLSANVQTSHEIVEESVINESELGINSTEPSSSGNIESVCIKKEPQFREMEDEDIDAVNSILNRSYEKIDDDIMIQRVDFYPPPIEPEQAPYQVKVNDVISGNMPFAVNVCFCI